VIVILTIRPEARFLLKNKIHADGNVCALKNPEHLKWRSGFRRIFEIDLSVGHVFVENFEHFRG
jgi:hypothetical protein